MPSEPPDPRNKATLGDLGPQRQRISLIWGAALLVTVDLDKALAAPWNQLPPSVRNAFRFHEGMEWAHLSQNVDYFCRQIRDECQESGASYLLLSAPECRVF